MCESKRAGRGGKVVAGQRGGIVPAAFAASFIEQESFDLFPLAKQVVAGGETTRQLASVSVRHRPRALPGQRRDDIGLQFGRPIGRPLAALLMVLREPRGHSSQTLGGEAAELLDHQPDEQMQNHTSELTGLPGRPNTNVVPPFASRFRGRTTAVCPASDSLCGKPA